MQNQIKKSIQLCFKTNNLCKITEMFGKSNKIKYVSLCFKTNNVIQITENFGKSNKIKHSFMF